MKKTLIAIILLLASFAHAQMTREQFKEKFLTKKTAKETRKITPNACNFYNSAEDYYNNIPIEDVEWDGYNYATFFDAEKIKLIKNGKEELTKVSDLPYDWVSSNHGILMRKFNGVLYQIVVNGPICYYVRFDYGTVTPMKDSYFFLRNNADKFFDFYSETLKGEIKEMNEKVMDKFLEQYGLEEQYKNDKIKREMKDSVNGYMTKQKNKLIKYINLINEKLSNKQ